GFEMLGSWHQHAVSWLNEKRAPVHLVRYHEIVEDPAAALRGMLQFLGHEADERRIAQTVQFSAFEQLRALEQQTGFTEAPDPARGPFFRVGKSMQWLGVLSDEQVRRILEPNHDLLKALGLATYATQPMAQAS